MSTTIPKKGKAAVTINPDMPDYNKTSFAIKKAGKAHALITKYGLPKDVKPKKGK
jgi:hypothetical protein